MTFSLFTILLLYNLGPKICNSLDDLRQCSPHLSLKFMLVQPTLFHCMLGCADAQFVRGDLNAKVRT